MEQYLWVTIYCGAIIFSRVADRNRSYRSGIAKWRYVGSRSVGKEPLLRELPKVAELRE